METQELEDRIELITSNLKLSGANKMRLDTAIFKLATDYLARCETLFAETYERNAKPS